MKIKVKSANELLRYANKGARVVVREKAPPPDNIMPLLIKALAAQRSGTIAEVRKMLEGLRAPASSSSIELSVQYGKDGLLDKVIAVSESEVVEFVPVRGHKRRIERITVNKERKQ